MASRKITKLLPDCAHQCQDPTDVTCPLNVVSCGSERIFGISSIHRVSDVDCYDGYSTDKLLIGFRSTDFVVMLAKQRQQLMRVSCGGGRRPWDVLAPNHPSQDYLFAFVRDGELFLHAHPLGQQAEERSPDTTRELTQPNPDILNVQPLNLHGRYHEREIHKLRFLRAATSTFCDGKVKQADVVHDKLIRHAWWAVLTASEDGSVRQAWMKVSLPGLAQPHDRMYIANDSVQARHSLPFCRGRLQSDDYNECLESEKTTLSAKDLKVLNCTTQDFATGLSLASDCHVYQEVVQSATKEDVQKMRSATDGAEVMQDAMEVGSTSAGTAFRDLDCLTYNTNGDSIVVGVGAKEVIMVWQIVCAEEATLPRLSLLQSRDPPSRGLHPKTYKIDTMPSHNENRYMAVSIMKVPDELTSTSGSSLQRIYLVAAKSDASLTLLCLNLRDRRWQNVMELSYNAAVILSLKQFSCRHGPCFLISGGTDGSIGLWDLSSAIEAHVQKQMTDVTEGDFALVNPAHMTSSTSPHLLPIWTYSSLHQSGINALDFVVLDQDIRASSCVTSSHSERQSMLIVSGGDDQALNVIQVDISALGVSTNGTRFNVYVQHIYRKENAHMSDLKGLACSGGVIFSVGLDQYLRCWKLHEHIKYDPKTESNYVQEDNPVLQETFCCALDVMEPSSIDVASLHGDCSNKNVNSRTSNYLVGISGHGFQILNISGMSQVMDSCFQNVKSMK